MNEYWQAEEFPSFCFCQDGEWYQVKSEDPSGSEWALRSVDVDGGLPLEMKENYYNEISLEEMLESIEWTQNELESRVEAQLNSVD